MLRLTRKFLRFEPGPNLSTEVLGNALKAVPMSLEPCNLAGKRGWVKEFVLKCIEIGAFYKAFTKGREISCGVYKIAQTIVSHLRLALTARCRFREARHDV